MSKALVAEFIGTFALIFIGAGSGVVAGMDGTGGSLITVALAHGLTIMIFAYAYGHISGTHINPAVTLGLTAAGKFEASKVGPYLGAQLLGAIVAALVLRFVVFGNADSGLGTPGVGSMTNMGGALVAELIGTFFLINTICNAAVSGKAGNLAPIAIGLTVGVGIMAFGPISGASFNPARTLGPAIASANFGAYIWLAVVAEIIGGVLAGLLYRNFLEEANTSAAAPEPPRRRK
jgi:aquaporin Z